VSHVNHLVRGWRIVARRAFVPFDQHLERLQAARSSRQNNVRFFGLAIAEQNDRNPPIPADNNLAPDVRFGAMAMLERAATEGGKQP
jgi:hypothetical protein